MTYGVQDIKKRYGVGEHTVLQWIRQGELRAFSVSRKCGGRPKWKVTDEALADFELLRQATPPTPRKRRRKQPTTVKEFFLMAKPPFQKLFETFGMDFSDDRSGDNIRAVECPYCLKEKFYLNAEDGQWDCKNCGEDGNAYDFIRSVHKTALEATTDDHLRRLKKDRELSLQTLKRFGIVWSDDAGCFLVPTFSAKGEVLNFQRYFPPKGNQPSRKLALSGMHLRVFGLDKLGDDPNDLLFVCEGPWDAIALDRHLRKKKTRTRYDILALPSANCCVPELVPHLKGRTVRLCFDNDKAGRDTVEAVVKTASKEKIRCELFALEWTAEYPEKADIRDLVADGENVADFTRKHCIRREVAQRRLKLIRGDRVTREPVKWLWRNHIPFGTLVSEAGLQGVNKSTQVRDLAARCTNGLSMPPFNYDPENPPEPDRDPFDVIYLTSEDRDSVVCDIVKLHGGDLSRLHVYDMASGKHSDGPIDLLECLPDFEELIRQHGVRLVIIDALNSFVGGDISTDSKARRTLSGRLGSLARRTGATIIGIRNWGRDTQGTNSAKTLGAMSLSDVARCVMHIEEITEKDGPRHFQLQFEKVSDGKQPKPLKFSIKDMSTADDESTSHLRVIKWDEPTLPIRKQKKVAKKVARRSSLANGRRKRTPRKR